MEVREVCDPNACELRRQARKLYHLVKEQGLDGALGIVQGEHALERIEFAEQAAAKKSDPEVQP